MLVKGLGCHPCIACEKLTIYRTESEPDMPGAPVCSEDCLLHTQTSGDICYSNKPKKEVQ